MKWILSIALSLFLVSCSSEEEDLQKIDQVTHFYYKNGLGEDLLVADSIGSYTSIVGNDIQGVATVSPVSFAKVLDENGINFLRYEAGARRTLLDSVSVDEKFYVSKIALKLTKKLTDSTTIEEKDTMVINYKWTPAVFEVSQVFYNNQLVFQKQASQPNVVTIIK